MNDAQRKKYRDLLLELRDDYRNEVQIQNRHMAEDIGDRDAASRNPTHPADQDNEGIDADQEVARIEQSLYEQVAAALDRFDAGRYGECESCGREIEHERLDELPYAAQCASCARSEATR